MEGGKEGVIKELCRREVGEERGKGREMVMGEEEKRGRNFDKVCV